MNQSSILDRTRTKTTQSPVLRGRWCNLCGARLAGGADALSLLRWNRRSEQIGPDNDGATWSICSRCYRERLRCAACQGTLGEQSFMLEGDSRFYCRDCFTGRPRCDTCDRPVSERYWSRHDGRNLCERCHSTAVTDPRAAQALFRQVKTALSTEPGITLSQPCRLELVSRRQLLALVDNSHLATLNADSRGRCFGLFLQAGTQRTIFVEGGLPRILMLEVIAHETAHAWQSELGSWNKLPEAEEGFAEWVAYKFLHSLGCYRRSDRMLRRNDLYGRGLRMVLAWEEHGGTPEVFRRVRAAY